jgi:hypothetical protein
MGGWVSPRTGLDNVEKRKFLLPHQDSNSDPSVVQLVASHYSDFAILSRHRSKDNIKINLRQIGWGGMDRINLTQDRDWWQAVVNTVMKL